MEFKIRDGEIDVAVLAGPRIKVWPTHGARSLSRWCSDAGLKVGWYGGSGLTVRGVLPGESNGGLVLMEDVQKRLHRIQAKAIVKITPQLSLPYPFEGWYSPGLIPESTARKLMAQGSLNWHSLVVILGSGNQAIRLGIELLQQGLSTQVICVESYSTQSQCWEVERRRFEILGGKILFAKPIQLSTRSSFTWEIRLQEGELTHYLEVARVISVGPFEPDTGFREYPAGSFLIEWENTETALVQNDVSSHLLDESRAVVLASRLIRGLGDFSSLEFKQSLDRALWASKQRLRELERNSSFAFEYEGKWLSPSYKQLIHQFPGTPKNLQPEKIVASIECIEPIACRVCEKECPVNAIQIERTASGNTQKFLLEDACTGCGKCVQACPSAVPVMIEGDQSKSYSTLLLGYREKQKIKKGDRVSLLNRKGEVLVSSRVLDQFVDGEVPLFKVEVPSHLIWEVRGMVSLAAKAEVDHADEFYQEKGARVEVQIQGDTRRVREGQMVSVALFEIGMSRPNDILICEDGSCGLCQIEADGVKRLACQTTIHQGMAIRFTRDHEPSSQICPCNELTVDQVQQKFDLTRTETIEAFLSSTEVIRGRCHGLLCKSACMKLAQKNLIKTMGFVDWSFPWMDWTLTE